METISITVISALMGILATIYTTQRTAKKDAQQHTSDSVSMREEIKYISKGVDEIKYDTKSLNQAFSAMNERLARAEEQIRTLDGKLGEHLHKHP